MKRGFTLIELLVVVAIMGILSSVVVLAVESTRNQGRTANVQATLNNVISEAALYNADQSPRSFSGLCTADTSEYRIQSQIETACLQGTNSTSGCTCYASDNTFVIAVPLRGEDDLAWCVDSGNYTGTITMTRYNNLSATNLCQ